MAKRLPLIFTFAVPVLFALVLIFAPSRNVFLSLTSSHPYIMGFVKFALLATAGEILAGKISGGEFKFQVGALPKAVVWGILGAIMACMIPLYSGGVGAAQGGGYLPFAGNTIAHSIFTSIAMNLTFGIVLMSTHRITDTYIELRFGRKKPSVLDAVAAVDWKSFVGFVVFKTLPFFWIPAHSVTFALPGEYRVFVSAFLSMVLGAILAIAKKKK